MCYGKGVQIRYITHFLRLPLWLTLYAFCHKPWELDYCHPPVCLWPLWSKCLSISNSTSMSCVHSVCIRENTSADRVWFWNTKKCATPFYRTVTTVYATLVAMHGICYGTWHKLLTWLWSNGVTSAYIITSSYTLRSYFHRLGTLVDYWHSKAATIDSASYIKENCTHTYESTHDTLVLYNDMNFVNFLEIPLKNEVSLELPPDNEASFLDFLIYSECPELLMCR